MQGILRIRPSDKQRKGGVSFLNYNEAEEYDRHLVGVKRRAQRKEQRKKRRRYKRMPADAVFDALVNPINTTRLEALIMNNVFRANFKLFLECLVRLGRIPPSARNEVDAVHEMFTSMRTAVANNQLSYDLISNDLDSNFVLGAIGRILEFINNTSNAVSESESDSDSVVTAPEALMLGDQITTPSRASSSGSSTIGSIDSDIFDN